MEFNSPAGEWWLSLRLSNSENLLRLNMEADSQNLLDSKFKEIKKFLLTRE
jgi:phosphomannomutase